MAAKKSTKKTENAKKSATPAKPTASSAATGPASGTTKKPTSDTAKPAGAPARPTKAASTTEAKPTLDQIRQRAYEIYVRRGGHGGNPEADWLQAERELTGAPRR